MASVFKKKLDQFLGNNWKNQVDINLNNALIKQRSHLENDQIEGQEFIKDFINKNKVLVATASQDFQEQIGNLVNYLTEEYHGYWDTVSLKIKDKYGKRLNPDVVKQVKIMALNDYGTRVREDTDNPKEFLIVPKIPISKLKPFEDELKLINKNLVSDIVTLPTTKYNLANKMNKEESEQERIRQQEEDDIDDKIELRRRQNAEQFYKEKNMTEKLLNRAGKLLEAVGISYEPIAFEKFVERNASKVKAIVENANSKVDAYRLQALIESQTINEEMTTADMNVPQMAVTSTVVRNRLNGFDPYGKNIANTSGNTKTVTKFDADVLQESLKKMDIDKMRVIVFDIENNIKYSNVLVESFGEKKQLVIEKQSFVDFVKDNADTSKYIVESVFDFERYLSSRTNAFVGVLLKEYFKRMIKEDENQELHIDNVLIDEDSDMLQIHYGYGFDDENRIINTSLDNFIEYICYGDDLSNFDAIWDNMNTRERTDAVKDYLHENGIGKINMNEAAIKEQVTDYNDWKEKVATKTNSDYKIKAGKQNESVSKAVDGKGNEVGEWISNKKLGFIYK